MRRSYSQNDASKKINVSVTKRQRSGKCERADMCASIHVCAETPEARQKPSYKLVSKLRISKSAITRRLPKKD